MSDEKPTRLPQLRVHYDTTRDRKSDESSESDTQSVTTERKCPRYLSDIDRSIIIHRLEKGEKQADLAREFRVTRAAISHINKHKAELLTRELNENYSRPSTELDNLIEVRTASASVLTTRIKDKTTEASTFRAAADRLIRLLLEEALVSFGSAEVATSDGVEIVTVDGPPCGFALEREGYGENNATTWQVLSVDLPDAIASTSVLLLAPILLSASLACAAIKELRVRGVVPSAIGIVCISCAFEAARDIADRQPEVTIITAAVDRHAFETDKPFDAFVQRYYASTTESSDA